MKRQWRDIKFAPKDGHPVVLGWLPNGRLEKEVRSYWDKKKGAWSGWWTPTHWRRATEADKELNGKKPSRQIRVGDAVQLNDIAVNTQGISYCRYRCKGIAISTSKKDGPRPGMGLIHVAWTDASPQRRFKDSWIHKSWIEKIPPTTEEPEAGS